MKQPDEKGIDVVIKVAASGIVMLSLARGLKRTGADVHRYR
ncbi:MULTISPECIES: hypothetical protein [unclassified Psychrobacter]|nr:MULTISPECIES: hypothetical protein [unclassified Psychrobacter]